MAEWSRPEGVGPRGLRTCDWDLGPGGAWSQRSRAALNLGNSTRHCLTDSSTGLLRAHERLARERNKLKGDDRQLRLEALKAHDFEAYQEMLRAQSTGAASAGEKYVAISKFLKGEGWRVCKVRQPRGSSHSPHVLLWCPANGTLQHRPCL